jgi:hypothetical protein
MRARRGRWEGLTYSRGTSLQQAERGSGVCVGRGGVELVSAQAVQNQSPVHHGQRQLKPMSVRVVSCRVVSCRWSCCVVLFGSGKVLVEEAREGECAVGGDGLEPYYEKSGVVHSMHRRHVLALASFLLRARNEASCERVRTQLRRERARRVRRLGSAYGGRQHDTRCRRLQPVGKGAADEGRAGPVEPHDQLSHTRRGQCYAAFDLSHPQPRTVKNHTFACSATNRCDLCCDFVGK